VADTHSPDRSAAPGIGYYDVERVGLKTEFPVASESPDHLRPRGTKQDNSRYPRFNTKIYGRLGPPVDLGVTYR
jgi:hypothetical protein